MLLTIGITSIGLSKKAIAQSADYGDASHDISTSSDLYLGNIVPDRIALNTSGDPQTFNVIFTIPVGVVPGDTSARFSPGQVKATAESATGASTGIDNGEVEDYQIASAPASLCPNTKADLWFANDESGSVNTTEFEDALDFIYQISDSFIYDDATEMKAGIISWASAQPRANRNNIIIPISDSFGDPDDSGLISAGNINVDGDNQGVRERYTSRQDLSGGTRLDRATNYLASLINNGNGRRANTPQVAIILTDAFNFQITGNGGGNSWVNAANTLKNAGADGTSIVLVLIDAAARAYNSSSNSPGDVKDVVDRVVGNGRLLVVPSYSDAADATKGYVETVSQAVCDSTTPIASDPGLLLVKRITAINPGQPDETQFNDFVDDPNSTQDNNSLWPDSDEDPSSNSNLYLRGVLDGGRVKPGDEVEYTIYFLSNGDEDARDVKICDVVPNHLTYVKDGYGLEIGIALGFDPTIAPTAPNHTLTNLLDDDEGDFYGAGTAPPANLCKKIDQSNSLV
ncbi:MAG: GEVED domain-containing protein, partial [Cyanobacteria bacterium J06631_2]